MGIDDESSHPELCSGVAGGVTPNIVSLFREPDAVETRHGEAIEAPANERAGLG